MEHTEASHSIQIAGICPVAFAHYTIVALNRRLVMRMSGLCDRNGMGYVKVTMRTQPLRVLLKFAVGMARAEPK